MCEWHLFSLKLTETFQGKVPKNEVFDSQDTKPYVTVLLHPLHIVKTLMFRLTLY